MDIANHVQNIIPKTDSPEKIYELFRTLDYPKDKVLDPSYKRKIEEFEFAKEEKEKIKDIYTVFNFDGKLQIFLIETKSLSIPLVKYLTKRLSDRYLRFLLILTANYKEYTFVFPEFESVEEGKHKLKITRLNFDRENPYYTDLLTISNIALTGEEENWRDIWKRWKDAFSVEKVTNRFFEDYQEAFFTLRGTFEKQKIFIKSAHELSQQFLNRLMFLYFLSKKRWLNDDPKFIKWYWERYKEEKRKGKAKDNTFYENWLRILFLEAFNNQYGFKNHPYLPAEVKSILSDAPFLNGGLFHRNELDDLPFSISDSLFEKVFSFFEKYNFTIREDIPLDIEVAVDPQMIGYVYESLSNVAEEIYERQDLGIFYTPTVEVDFMCRRSVVEYLTNHLDSQGVIPAKAGIQNTSKELDSRLHGNDEETVHGDALPKDWIYRLLFDEDKKAVAEHISKQKLWYRLEELLDNLAIVDPACGSGAFLVGMLHVLAELYRLIYSHITGREMSEFELKKKIIGNSLYGVDVMPWAVHSAELRLWLQLIIEEDIPYEQRKLFPLLPNLNLRLRVGDSLVQEIGGINLHIRDSRLSPAIKKKLTSLKTEKEKYYNNDPTAKFKSDKSLLQEELRIFGEILDDKIINLQKEIQGIEGEKRKLQIEMFKDSEKESEKQKNLFEEQIKAKGVEIEHLTETRRKIQSPEKKPFIWDIDFAEIFGDKGGFDIVIGNPPYVRQEKIAPPNKLKAEVMLEDKREYKDKLLKSIQVHYPFVKKLDKKSDYYIYFYFHGLSLLNEQGTFCFITSNSWLDVGYGKDLQEFLLKYCHVKAIYDNEAKRSFEHADVNTVIALFGSPLSRGVGDVLPPFSKGGQGGIWPALSETARFIMFKDAFDKVINTKNLLAIEKADSIHKTESYRVYPVKQETLLEEGWEQPEEEPTCHSALDAESSAVSSVMPEGLKRASGLSLDSRSPLTTCGDKLLGNDKKRRHAELVSASQSLLKEKFVTGKYEGNKWGGKYLRAPDIYWQIMEKNKNKLTQLKNIGVIKPGCYSGLDKFFYIEAKSAKELGIEKRFLTKIIENSKQAAGIRIDNSTISTFVFSCQLSKDELRKDKYLGALEYIKWGEKQIAEAGQKRKAGLRFCEVPSVKNRQPGWWSIPEKNLMQSYIFIPLRVRQRWLVAFSEHSLVSDRCFTRFILNENALLLKIIAFMNSAIFILFQEVSAFHIGGGGGPLELNSGQLKNGLVLKPDLLNENIPNIIDSLSNRKIKEIYEELGINPACPIREQMPNPLPDRKALDDIVFDILGLTEDERREVYWSVCELVANRLKKAKSL